MYNNEIYPVRYPVDAFNNQGFNNDFYGMPPENNQPYPPMPQPPMPCPPYHPPMPPMPCPPQPPIVMPPDWKLQCMMHMKDMLEKLMHKKVSLIIEGTRCNFDCVKILKMDDCVVMVETKTGICVVPYHEITAICMSKEVAEHIMDY